MEKKNGMHWPVFITNLGNHGHVKIFVGTIITPCIIIYVSVSTGDG